MKKIVSKTLEATMVDMSPKEKVKSEAKLVKAWCDRCSMRCPLDVTIQDGRVVKVSKALCVKGTAIPEIMNSPDRLLYPLRRAGERGGGEWRRISWDEALDEAAGKFKEILENYGAEAIGVHVGDNHHGHMVEIGPIFVDALKLPNRWGASQMCMYQQRIATCITLGENIVTDVGPDPWHANCILVWAGSVTDCRPHMGRAIVKAKKDRGAKLIVVDPRPTQVAKIADVWLQVRPGTDCALALGMMNVIVNEELYDKDFVEKWCVGFDKLKERVQKYPPEKVAEICWVAKEELIEAARMYATIKPACFHARLGTQAQINGTQTVRALCSLLALSGNIDVEGGNLLPNPLGGFKHPLSGIADRLQKVNPETVNPKRIGAKEFPLYCETFQRSQNSMSWKAVYEGKIKGMLIPCSNPVISDVNSRYIWEALKRLDWFVVLEAFMTPTAELADIVFPGCTWWEVEGGPKDSFRSPGTSPDYFAWSDKLVEAPGECRDEREVIIDLLKRMGVKTTFNTLEEIFDKKLETLNIKYKDLKVRYPDKMVTFPPPPQKRYEERGFRFNTPSGKVELYSSIFERFGYDPLPDHKEPTLSPVSTPEIFKDYPLILITYRDLIFMKSEGRNIRSLRERRPDPTLQISPQTAQQLGIKEGDKVWYETPLLKGVRVRAKAELVPGLQPKVVATCYMWWLPEMPGPEHGCFEVCVNTVLPMDPPYDPIQGSPAVKNCLCKVGKAY